MKPMTRTALFTGILVAAGAVSWFAPARAQARNDDVLPALLTEVRGLRAAMEQMASGSTQAQVLIGRLQLQEGRVTSMVRRLDTVRDNLVAAQGQYAQIQGALSQLGHDDPADPVPQKDKDDLLSGLKAQVAAAKANVDRLSAEEMALTADIATEQQRWTAINQRLDDLERTLAKR